MQKEEILNKARQHGKKNFKSTQYVRAYRAYCNNVELVKPDTFRGMVEGNTANVVQMNSYNNVNKSEIDKVNTFVKSYVNKHSGASGKD